MCFNTLTCVERYVAVVHPITYWNLKNAQGVQIKNVVIGCTWLLSYALASFMNVKSDILPVVIFSFITALCIIVVFFCSLSVLLVLIRPGPGRVGGSREQLDKSKLRAFHTIVIILAVLLIMFGTSALLSVLYASGWQAEDTRCHLSLSMVWMTLPVTMVLPVLFLQRAGWFDCCKSNK